MLEEVRNANSPASSPLSKAVLVALVDVFPILVEKVIGTFPSWTSSLISFTQAIFHKEQQNNIAVKAAVDRVCFFMLSCFVEE